MKRPRAPVELAHARVRFPPDFARRLERLVLELASARERREGAGGAALAGRGEELVGFRPYRPGEDLRGIDWSLYARLDRPYVRVTRREASERWTILVDTSASMGVGPPGKLQAAAEIACALVALALRQGARATVVLTGAEPGERRELRVRAKSDLLRLFALFESTVAAGARGIGAALGSWRPPPDAGRVLVCGDLVDVEPAALAVLRRRGRELFALQVLAPIELAPPAGGAVEWADPESGERVALELAPALAERYRRELEQVLETWRASCARHGIAYALASSAEPFEDVVPRLLGLAAPGGRGARAGGR